MAATYIARRMDEKARARARRGSRTATVQLVPVHRPLSGLMMFMRLASSCRRHTDDAEGTVQLVQIGVNPCKKCTTRSSCFLNRTNEDVARELGTTKRQVSKRRRKHILPAGPSFQG